MVNRCQETTAVIANTDEPTTASVIPTVEAQKMTGAPGQSTVEMQSAVIHSLNAVSHTATPLKPTITADARLAAEAAAPPTRFDSATCSSVQPYIKEQRSDVSANNTVDAMMKSLDDTRAPTANMRDRRQTSTQDVTAAELNRVQSTPSAGQLPIQGFNCIGATM